MSDTIRKKQLFCILAGTFDDKEIFVKDASVTTDGGSTISTTANICSAKSFPLKELCEDWMDKNMDKRYHKCKIALKTFNLFY